MRNSIGQIKKGKFVAVWLMLFSVLFTVASIFGLVPQAEDKEALESFFAEARAESESNEAVPEVPLRVKAEKVGLNTSVLNPESRDISVLDQELTKGAVRYPGSGLAGGDNNMFLFGHSSHLPVVNNQAYKAFNDIEDLEEGDEVVVETANYEFVYEVTSVRLASADEVLVEFETGKAMLTLSTCNNFGAKTERFVVEAELVGSRVK
jgi:LPXTG-site transpeptidase (sortase) family protein